MPEREIPSTRQGGPGAVELHPQDQGTDATDPHDQGTDATDPHDRVGEDFDPLAAAREDGNVAAAGLNEIIVDLQVEVANLRAEVAAARLESAEASEMLAQEQELAEQHQADYRQLIALVEEMQRRGPNQGPDLGCQAVSKVKALKEETKRARKRWPGRVWDTIWDKLKTVLPRIWSMISHLLAVKEWTVSGQAGTRLFGLAQVGISITFG